MALAKGATLFATACSVDNLGAIQGSDTSKVGQISDSRRSPRTKTIGGNGLSGHGLNSFVFQGTVTGYRSSQRNEDESHPHRYRLGMQ